MACPEFDYLFKILLVGNAGTAGKTELIYRFKLNKDPPCSTIGVDFAVTTVKIDGKTIQAKFWDTGMNKICDYNGIPETIDITP